MMCVCGHPKQVHHHLDECAHEDCPCRVYRPAEEETA